jgi:hypothetical protein
MHEVVKRNKKLPDFVEVRHKLRNEITFADSQSNS